MTDRPTSWMQREMGIAVDLANDGRSRSAARLKYSLNDGGSWRQQRIPGKKKMSFSQICVVGVTLWMINKFVYRVDGVDMERN